MNRDELKLADALIWFANAEPKSYLQVANRFLRANNQERVFPSAEGTVYFETLEDVHDRFQPTARDNLAHIIGIKKKSSEDVVQLARRLKDVIDHGVVAIADHELKSGVLHVRWRVALTGVEAGVAYASAIVLSSPSLGRRIGLCAHEDCNKFFLDKRQRGGRAMAYCSTKHSDDDRQRRKRRRDEAAKHK